jgi:alpha-beta hydrolase superfamily lysophospholipase
MNTIAVKDELLDAQTLRAAGISAYGGADVGECIATARRVRGTDLTSWYDEWTATARRTEQLAARCAAAGQRESAKGAYFRASTYYRTAGVMLLGAPIDPRLVASNTEQTRAFRDGAALLDNPPEIVPVPYENTSLPGYFFAVDQTGTPRPTVILLGGYDGTADELYFVNGAAALARGYNVLAFDGPGQGSALVQQQLPLRPDWDHVITPVVDYLIDRPDVDAQRIVLIGMSLGAHLAPRAAAGEHRLSAVIADCGSYDVFAAALERMPSFLAAGFRERRPRATKLVARILRKVAAKPTAGWALRRGQLVHGVDGPLGYLDALRDYTLKPYAPKIECPTLVCNADSDDISASAPQLVAALTCEHDFITFTAADGADDHCEAGARTLYHALTFDWLDRRLLPEPQPVTTNMAEVD